MSNLVIRVHEVKELKPHTNADRLELLELEGYQCVVGKDNYKPGDLLVYFPIDTLLTDELAEQFGVKPHLGSGNRVKCAKLRGEPSFGLTSPSPNPEWVPGQDVTEYYQALGVKRYDPPLRTDCGDAERPHALLEAYTEIENLRHYPNVFLEGEQALITEKVHGSCALAACIEGEFMASSKQVRRKKPETEEAYKTNLYWFPFTLDSVKNLLTDLGKANDQVILYGEVYGRVQSLRYGLDNGLGFRAFDLKIKGRFVDFYLFEDYCKTYKVPMVPVLANIPFNFYDVAKLSEGKTTLMSEQVAHIREGVVVKPIKERLDPTIGRVILKFVSDTYLLTKEKGKAISDYKDV